MIPSDYNLPARFNKFRKFQHETALKISVSEKRFNQLEAPPGLGKSLIYMTIVKILNVRALILVKKLTLQDQLIREFSEIGAVDIRGQNNYKCLLIEDRHVDCSNGPCHTGTFCKLKQRGCLYFDAERRARAAPIVVTTVAKWATLNRYGDGSALGKFGLLVIDEAHSLPEWLADSFQTTIRQDEFDSYPDDQSRDLPVWRILHWASWARSALTPIKEDYRKYKRRGELVSLKKITDLGHRVRVISTADEFPDEWIIENRNSQTVFSLRWAQMYTEKTIFCSMPKVLLISASLPEKVMDNLGVDKIERDRIELPSIFNPSHRPVIWIPTVRVDWKMTDGHKATLYRKMDNIISRGLDFKGIVHTRSYARQKEALRASSFRNIMLTDLDEWMLAQPPAVLVSPTVEEGHTFDHDRCRYQIILKLPRLDKRNISVGARMQADKSYSNYSTGIAIVQTVGRIVRDFIDWGVTFILDDHWGYFRNLFPFPHYFKLAFKKSTDIPDIGPPV